jgi:hypothetical protein
LGGVKHRWITFNGIIFLWLYFFGSWTVEAVGEVAHVICVEDLDVLPLASSVGGWGGT